MARGFPVYLTEEGSEWRAVFSGFVDIKTSPAGYGETPGDAVNELMDATGQSKEPSDGDFIDGFPG